MKTKSVEIQNIGNPIEREICGCKIRIFFAEKKNANIETNLLDSLLLAFERRVNLPNCFDYNAS